jgi:hypothetical protein
MRTLITVIAVVLCLQLWAQVPDTTSVVPGRLIIKVNQAFQTIGIRSDGIIETEQTWFNNLAIQYQIDVLRQMYVGSTRTYGTSYPTGNYQQCTSYYMGTSQDWWNCRDGESWILMTTRSRALIPQHELSRKTCIIL